MDWNKLLTEYITDFSNPKALGAWIAIFVLFLVPTNSLFGSFLDLFALQRIYALIIVAILLAWLINRKYLPKNRGNKVGIVISIFVENEPAQKTLKMDLVHKLRKNFDESDLKDLVHVVVVPNHVAETIKNAENIFFLNRKIKGHFWITGTVRKRAGKIYMDLEGMVMHRPIAMTVSNKLGREFRAALPKRLESLSDFAFQLSEFSGDNIYIVSRFITGTAAYFSGDPLLALKMHGDLLAQLRALPMPLLPNLSRVKSKLPKLICEENLLLARAYFARGDIQTAEKYLESCFNQQPNNYGALTLRSIIEFLHKHDAPKALATTLQAQKYAGSDYVWKYNKTFLQLWVGAYSDALKTARKIRSGVTDGQELLVVAEVEEFTKKLLQQPTVNPVIYFWLGYLNYHQKRNNLEAKKYFEEFIRRATPGMSLLVNNAKTCLGEI